MVIHALGRSRIEGHSKCGKVSGITTEDLTKVTCLNCLRKLKKLQVIRG